MSLSRAHQAFRAGRAIPHGKHDKAAHRRPAVASATAGGPMLPATIATGVEAP